MIHLSLHNLSAAVLGSVREDIRDVHALLAKAQQPMRDVSLRVIALSRSIQGVALPAHDLQTPLPLPPATFAKRCAWERQRQSYQFIEQCKALWIIAGDQSGALYGLYEALSCLTGVHWAAQDERQWVPGPVRDLPRQVQKPRVVFRGRNGAGTDLGDQASFIRWMGRNRWNIARLSSSGWMRKTPQQRETMMQLCEARCVQIGLGDHAIDYFITHEDYLAHPVWRGMRDGQRVEQCEVVIPEAPHLNAKLPIQPCFANEQLCETLTDRIAAHMAAFPSIELYAMWPHDGVNNWCQCERCASVAPHAMMHKLAVMLENKLPSNVMIETIAYSNLLAIPSRPLEKVTRTFSLFCPYLRRYEFALDAPGYDGPCSVGVNYPEPDRINTVDEREYGPLFEKWVTIWEQAGVAPGIFEYTGNFPDETFRTTRTRYGYHPPVQLIAHEIDWYLAHDVQVYYLCGAVRCWPDALDELALAHALWHGSEGLQETIDRYDHAIAGRQGKAVRAALQAVSDMLDAHQTPQAQVAHARTLLGHVKSGDQRQLYELWLDYVLLVRKACHAIEQGQSRQAIEDEQALQQWIDGHHARLGWAGRLSRLRRLSAISQQRMAERLHHKAGTKYVL